MLKLEKVTKDRTVAVRLREKESIFNSDFLRALSIAIALHLCAILGCKITATQVIESYLIKPPTIVDIDIGPSETIANTVSQVEIEKGILPSYVLEPEPSLPKHPPLPTTHCMKSVAWDEDSQFSCSLFHQLELVPYQSDPLTFLLKKQYAPVTLALSGPLADCDILDPGIGKLNNPRPTLKPTTEHLLTYHVQMDNKTGCIFWYDKEHKAPSQLLDSVAEAILKKMRFAATKSQVCAGLMVTRGIVEITFEVEDNQTADNLLIELEDR